MHNAQCTIIATGTILEASPFWMNVAAKKHVEVIPHFSFGPGTALLNPVAGITEYGTTKIVLQSHTREEVEESLNSLVSPNSFKYFRKRCLIAAVKNEPDLLNGHKIANKYKLGMSFAEDFLTLYFCWKFGVQWVQEFYCSNISENIKINNMSFVEKLNTKNMFFIDEKFSNILIERIKSYGIDQYTEKDYDDLYLVFGQLMSKNYYG